MVFFHATPYEKMAIVGLGEGEGIWVLRVQEKGKGEQITQAKQREHKKSRIFEDNFLL